MKNKNIEVLNVVGKINEDSTKIMDIFDFSTTTDHIVESTNFNQQVLPAIIDWRERKVFLSDINCKEKIDEIPFFYHWQRNNIKKLYSVPFSQYKKVPVNTRDVLPIFVFSIGRCGSTLLVNLCRSIGIRTISEPDYLANIKNMASNKQSNEEVADLLRWNTNLLYEIFGTKPLIKLRGSSIEDIEFFADAFPDSNYIFMLREPIAWAKSNMKAFNDTPEALANYLKNSIEAYHQFVELRVKPTLIWYEDLIQTPTKSLSLILNDLELIESKKDAINEKMSKDSQEGSSISKDKLAKIQLKPEYLDRFIKHWKEVCPTTLIEKYALNRLIIE